MSLKNTYIYPWKTKSLGASALSEALDIYRLLREGSKFEGGPDKTVINWGSSELPDEVRKCKVLNSEESVSTASDKLRFFQKIKNYARIPRFTTQLHEAIRWSRDGDTVVARTKLTARSGAGIVFFDGNTDEFVKAPLYTLYIKKKEEFRIHIAFGNIIDLQKKVLRKNDDEGIAIDPQSVDWRIRSHKNGFIFIKNDIFIPEDVKTQAMQAYVASELDFGAVDVIFNESQQQAYVLEINTA